jgi:hypothetical protein
MTERARGAGKLAKVAGVIALAAFVPGCIDLPEDTKTLLEIFISVLLVNTAMQLVVLLLLLFYFLPFTRPMRPKKRKRK